MLPSLLRMIKCEIIKMVMKNKALLLHEAEKINGFMGLLMKPRNSRQSWTKEEKRLLRMHLRHLSYYVPAIIIFILPFGSLLIPLLAEILDRRRSRRMMASNAGISSADINNNRQAV